MYYWIAKSTDNSYEEVSEPFKTKKEAYENMRNSALEKMKWNTEYDEDFEDDIPIGYGVTFSRDCIRHISYSGEYIYNIVEE